MTIVQLEYLLAVVNHGSFSAAAEYCFVTQPSLSMQISNLEEELGVVLLDRNSRPIVSTEAGLIVLEQAREVVSAFYGTKEKINSLRGDLSGKLRVGVIPTISPYLMPLFVPEFQKKCPNVELDVRDMYTSNIIEALNRDMIDIAILSGGESAIKIREIELFNDKLYLYVSKKNELYERNSSILIEDIDVSKLLILSEGNCLRNQVLRLCQAKKKIHSSYNFINCSLETLMHMTDALAGTTIIPGMAISFIPQEKHKQIKHFGRSGAHRRITMAVGRTYVKESLINAVQKSILTVAEQYALSDYLII